MTYTIEPQLSPVSILDLRPTQITVGMREVEEKRKRLREKEVQGQKAGPTFSTTIISRWPCTSRKSSTC